MPLKYLSILVSAVVFLAAPSFAMDTDHPKGECASCHRLTVKEATELLKNIGGTVKSIRQAPTNGLFELLMEKDGKKGIVYIDYAKKHLLQGFITSLDTLQMVSAYAEEFPQSKQATHIDPKTIPVDKAIILGNPQGAKKLYVFTDPDCPYCRKLHGELLKLEKIAPDVAIYVLLFPLPMHPGAFDQARGVIAGKSRDLLDKAFAGKDILHPGGDAGGEAVREIGHFADLNHIQATPTMVLDDGTVVTGFRTADELKKFLDGSQ